ncbi:hypothetical protein ACWOC1_14400 [Enterococcus quebecensis]|uniref:hypothetical protein n=1 Tax=Enterococcus quebecensis TaxID=903983 RepID=UPI0009004B27|nr:hypothetical protein [Enterococcus quebecensis]
MKKNVLIKLMSTIVFSGICLLGFSSKSEADVTVLNLEIYRPAHVSVNSWGERSASFDVYSFQGMRPEHWRRTDSRGALVAFQDRLQGYINFDVYFSTTNQGLLVLDDKGKVYRGSFGPRPWKNQLATTVNKDKDRFERNQAGNYITVDDSGYGQFFPEASGKDKIDVKAYNLTNWIEGIKVSMSKWRNSEDSSNYTLGFGTSERWSRTNPRGNLMVIDNAHTYYVKPGESVLIIKLAPNSYDVFIDRKKVKTVPTV